MAQNRSYDDKIAKSSAAQNAPEEVVVDPELSQEEKAKALAELEQDARRMEESAAEGMGGGEPTADLHAVLEAREALDMTPVAFAYHVVTHDLRERLATGPASERHLVEHALHAIEALNSPAQAAAQAPDIHSAEYQAEVEDEIRRERLDP